MVVALVVVVNGRGGGGGGGGGGGSPQCLRKLSGRPLKSWRSARPHADDADADTDGAW